MAVRPIAFVLAAAAAPLLIIGAGVVGIVVGTWFDWPIAEWIWDLLP